MISMSELLTIVIDFIAGYPDTVNWFWTIAVAWILGGIYFFVAVIIQDKRNKFPNGIKDTLFGACIVSVIWPIGVMPTFVDRPLLFFATIASVFVYYSLWWWVLGCVVLLIVGAIAEAEHRRNWEPTGDDIFPYRRKVGM